MKRSHVLSFVSGCALTGMMTSVTGDLQASKNAIDPATALRVCLMSDGEMRVITQSNPCPPEQDSLYLQRSDSDSPPLAAPSTDEEEIADLASKVRALEREAERGALTETVAAPFTVEDDSHNPIFEITSEKGVNLALLYDASHQPAVSLAGNANGGQVSAGGASARVYVGSFGDGQGIRILDNAVPRVDLGNKKDGPYEMRIFNAQHQSVAAIGENTLGSGTAVVANVDGEIKATVGVTADGHGAFSLFNAQKMIGNLTQGDFGGGLLALWGPSGPSSMPMVAAGSTDKGVGLVQVGPNGFKAGIGVLGLPGSYLAGKK